MSTDANVDLTRLPEPTPPHGLAATVMARVSRIPDRRSPVPVASPTRDVRSWAMALGGLAIVLASWIAGGFEPGWWLELVRAQSAAPADAIATPLNGAGLGVALGSVLYLGALLGSLRNRRITPPR